MSSVSPLSRPVFEALDVRADGPARTKGGRAWARWAKHGAYSGWYAVGARPPRLSGHPGFWEAVFSVACACAGSNVDQVHCCGEGILSLGGLGVTVRSGYAQLLLHCCLLHSPARYVEVMAPVMYETGVYPKPSTKSPSGVGLYYSDGHPVQSLRSVICEGSDGEHWSERQKKRAQLWVSSCSELLRDETMDAAQHAFVAQVMPWFLSAPMKASILWPPDAPTDWWQYTRELQMLWALTLILASLGNESEAERLVGAARECEDGSEDSALAILRRMQILVHDGTYPDTLRDLCVKATAMLAPLLGVEL